MLKNLNLRWHLSKFGGYVKIRTTALIFGFVFPTACAGGSPTVFHGEASPSPSALPHATPTAPVTGLTSPSPLPSVSSVASATPAASATPVAPTGSVTFELFYSSTAPNWVPGSVSITTGGQSLTYTNLTCNPAGEALFECRIEAPEQIGADTFLIKAFPSSDTNAGGSPTAVGSASANIAANASANLSVTMNGVPASVTFTINPSPVLADGVGGTITGLVTVLDNSGYAPLSPSLYEDSNGNPLTVAITDSDESGTFTLSPTTIAEANSVQSTAYPATPGVTPIVIHYNGSAIGNTTFHAAVGTIMTASAPLVVEAATTAEEKTIYIASHTSSSDQIDEYSATATGATSPIRSLTGSFSLVTGIAVDGSGNLYASNERTATGSDSILMFSPGATGNTAPSESLSGSNTQLSFPIGLALDSSRNTYVLDAGSTAGAQFISVYGSGSTGNVAPTSVINGPQTMLSGASAISVDAASDIFVVNNSIAGGNQGGVLEFTAGSSGNIAPSAILMTSLQLLSVVATQANSLFGGFDDGIASINSSSGNINYCAMIQASSGAQGGPVAVASSGDVFAANPLLGQIELFPPESAATECHRVFPYRTLKLTTGRTIDAIAVGN